MIKKLLIVIMLIATFLAASITVQAADETISRIDDTNDILKIDYNNVEEINVSKPNVDIEKITASKTGKEANLQLKLIDGGIIEKSNYANSDIILYNIELITSHHTYSAAYTGLEVASIIEQLQPEADQEFDEDFDYVCFVETDLGDALEDISYSGEGENILSITFDLYNSYERLISVSSWVTKEIGDGEDAIGFYDECFVENFIMVDAGGPYSGKIGVKIDYKGTLEEGDPDDYEWLWVIDDSSKMFEGSETSYTLNKADNYTGVLYVYDSLGNYGEDTFRVEVIDPSGGNGSNGGTESGIMIFVLIIVVIVIAGVAVVMFLLKR